MPRGRKKAEPSTESSVELADNTEETNDQADQESKPAVETKNLRDKVFKMLEKAIDDRVGSLKNNRPVTASLEAIEKEFKVKSCISTGLPSLDLMLMCAADGKSWGFPRGRVSEISAPESSLKTTLVHITSAQNILRNGISYYISSEFDLDLGYVQKIYADQGVDISNGLPMRPFYAKTLTEMREAVESIVEPLRKIHKNAIARGEDPDDYIPPVLIAVDSLAAMMAKENRDRLTKDWEEADKTGQHAKDLHDFFKFYLEDFARLGIAFIFTNHLRANLSPMSMIKTQIAHDAAVKYYCSLRIKCNLFNTAEVQKVKSVDSKAYSYQQLWEMKIEKKRAAPVRDEKVNIPYYLSFGFDYATSLMDACDIAGVTMPVGKEFKIDFDAILDEEIAEILKPFKDKNGEPSLMKDSDFNKILMKHREVIPALEFLCYENGPLPPPFEDPRVKK